MCVCVCACACTRGRYIVQEDENKTQSDLPTTSKVWLPSYDEQNIPHLVNAIQPYGSYSSYVLYMQYKASADIYVAYYTPV